MHYHHKATTKSRRDQTAHHVGAWLCVICTAELCAMDEEVDNNTMLREYACAVSFLFQMYTIYLLSGKNILIVSTYTSSIQNGHRLKNMNEKWRQWDSFFHLRIRSFREWPTEQTWGGKLPSRAVNETELECVSELKYVCRIYQTVASVVPLYCITSLVVVCRWVDT